MDWKDFIVNIIAGIVLVIIIIAIVIAIELLLLGFAWLLSKITFFFVKPKLEFWMVWLMWWVVVHLTGLGAIIKELLNER